MLKLHEIRTGKLVGRIALIAVLCVTFLWALDDVKIKLTNADGTSYFAIQDSGAATVFRINSDGEVKLGAWLGTAIAVANGGTGATDASTARTNLGLAIGTNVQAQNATLQSISPLGTALDKMLYTTGLNTWAEANLTTAGRAILDDADAAAQRTTLGLTIGTNVQAYNATLQSISPLGTAVDKMLYTTGVNTWAEANLTTAGRAILDDADAAAQRTTLGLGSMATLNSPLAILNGGTGQTTATAAFDALAPTQTGQSGKFLQTNGTTTSWATPAGGGSDPWTYLVLASDFTTTSVSAVDVTGLAFTPAANTQYEIIGTFMLRTAATASIPRVGCAWPTGMTDGVVNFTVTLAVGTQVLQNGNINAAVLTPVGSFPNTTSSYPAFMNSMIVAGASPSGTFKIQFASETGSTATMITGSFIRYRTLP